jgi:hypothetical protein
VANLVYATHICFKTHAAKTIDVHFSCAAVVRNAAAPPANEATLAVAKILEACSDQLAVVGGAVGKGRVCHVAVSGSPGS